jgi:superfamily I DNA and/or RNA helicase/very-short-patch-repair endonuclease
MGVNNTVGYKIVIDTIRQYGPIKAKKIAEILSLDKESVNAILYSSSMKKYVNLDVKTYEWSIVKKNNQDKKKVIDHSDPLLDKLCKYYLQCLSREQTKLSVFATSFYDPSYTQLSNFDVDEPDFDYIEKIDSDEYTKLSNSIKKTQKGYQAGNPKQACIGYPVLKEEFFSKKTNKPFSMLKPIFIITIDKENNTMQDIRLNLDAIQSLTKTNSNTILQEVSNIGKLLELHTNSDDISLIGDMLAKLKNEKTDWPWVENFLEYDDETDLGNTDDVGYIHNIAIFTGMEQSRYTRGLESELQSLSKMSKKDISGTALHHWLYPEENKAIINKSNNSDIIIEPMALNDEQRNAVYSALTSKLSVISGPPGTGKSQVVSNLLINSIYNNKSVLFSSKNNQAVDVVINRTNQLSSTPVLLHLSKQKKYSTLKHYCKQILSYVPSKKVKLNLDKNRRKFKQLNKELSNIDYLENKYREEVIKPELTYQKLLEKYKKSEDFIKSMSDVSSLHLKNHRILINTAIDDIETVRKNVLESYLSRIIKFERKIRKILKFIDKEVDHKNKGFWKEISWIFSSEEVLGELNKDLKSLNASSRKSSLKLSKHKLATDKNTMAAKKTLKKDLEYLKDHKNKYLKLDDWFFEGDKSTINSLIKEEDIDQDNEPVLKNNFVDLNDGKNIFPSNFKLSKYKESTNPNNLRKALILLNRDLSFITDCKEFAKYHISLKKFKKMDDSFALSKKMKGIQEDILETSVEIWEDYTKVRMSELESAKRKNVQEFLTVLGLLEDSHVKDGDRISDNKLGQKFNTSLKSIMEIAPCWSVTSLSAKSKIPFKKSQFKILVIDEASQNDIASVLPLLYRCEKAVIIGDENQLKHISSITAEEDEKLLDNLDLMDDIMWSYSQNSLFQRADNLCDNNYKTNLLNHFRSHGDIINFANTEFYGGSLRVATDYSNLKRVKGEQTIRWINVQGKAVRPKSNKSLTNIDEVNAIIKELSRLKDSNYEGSIGVVTPYRAQATLIDRELHRDENLYNWFVMNRGGAINTVHLFQGDERDIMLFSTVVTKSVNPSVMNFFKPNLFNVAITRARAGLIVFGHQKDCLEFDHRELKRLANYINDIGNRKVLVEDIQLPEFKDNKYPHSYVKELGTKYSEWEVLFYEALYKKGIRTIPQHAVDQYKLDLAFFDKDNPDRKLNIEVDGVEYHQDARGELIVGDRIRNLKMIELGWDVKRFWVHEIRDNLDGCIQDIIAWKNNVG